MTAVRFAVSWAEWHALFKFRAWQAMVRQCTWILLWLSAVVHADDSSMIPPGAMPLRPEDHAEVLVNPPIMTWPLLRRGPYVVEIIGPDGESRKHSVARNWLLLPQVLRSGTYRWKVSSPNDTLVDWRQFRIPSTARTWLVPPAQELLKKSIERARPRSVDVVELQASVDPSVRELLLKAVRRAEDLPLWMESEKVSVQRNQEDVLADQRELRKRSVDEEALLLRAATAWLTQRDELALALAKRRALALASLDPLGATSFDNHDQAGRAVAWSLALIFDWLHDQFSEDERRKLLDAIEPRVEQILGKGPFGIDRSLRLDVRPYDSHGVTALSRVAVICALLAGERPIFARCFSQVVPRYVALPIPWGEDDGGFSNGTAYAHWAVLDNHLLAWDFLGRMLGLNFYALPWVENYARMVAYFLPPGAPSGVFGDEAEYYHRQVWANQALALAARMSTSLTRWYARQFFREDPLHPALLLAHRVQKSGSPPEDADGGWSGNAAMLPSVGWAAMHSDLRDRERISIYFKSSPFGSFNHSHADQNGFVVHARGVPVIIDSGYYDYYGSPHWHAWYKQTRAHNAVTFDGGQGQAIDSFAAKGRIVHYEHRRDLDVVSGEAAPAYGSQVKTALRTLIYIRPSTLVVVDNLESVVGRTWEWNLHAAERFEVGRERRFALDSKAGRLCGRMIDDSVGQFSQSDRFDKMPSTGKPNQWHLRYSTSSRVKSVQFVAVFDIDCERSTATVGQVQDALTVTAGKAVVKIHSNGRVKVL